MIKTTKNHVLFALARQLKTHKPELYDYIKSLPNYQKTLRKTHGISEKDHQKACEMFK